MAASRPCAKLFTFTIQHRTRGGSSARDFNSPKALTRRTRTNLTRAIRSAQRAHQLRQTVRATAIVRMSALRHLRRVSDVSIRRLASRSVRRCRGQTHAAQLNAGKGAMRTKNAALARDRQRAPQCNTKPAQSCRAVISLEVAPRRAASRCQLAPVFPPNLTGMAPRLCGRTPRRGSNSSSRRLSKW